MELAFTVLLWVLVGSVGLGILVTLLVIGIALFNLFNGS